MDSLDLARRELGIRNLESTESSKGSCTFDFSVPTSFRLEFEHDFMEQEEVIVAKSGVDRILLHGVTNPKQRDESDWVFVLFPGRVSVLSCCPLINSQ